MHRLQAGTPDASGWITAESTNGRFSVQVPIPFNDFTVEDTDPASLTRNAEVVGCKSAEGIKFSATKIFYRTPGSAAEQFRNSSTGAGLPSATVENTACNGYPALNVSFGDSSAKANTRVVLVGEELYTLIVEWPVQQDALARQMVERFSASLKILP